MSAKEDGTFPQVSLLVGVPRTQKLRSSLPPPPSGDGTELIFKSGVSQNMALRASLTGRNPAKFLFSAFPGHSASLRMYVIKI